jgi:Cation transporter/ATPase, N-terminus
VCLLCAILAGDYAEDPDECPAFTTCPIVCVASATECPSTCDTVGETLCAETGRCGWNCTSVLADESSLVCSTSCPSRPVACPRVIDDYSMCLARFARHYDAQRQCIMDRQEQETKVSFASVWFVLCYGYYGALAIAVVAWCYYNQILAPVPTSTVPLHVATTKEGAAASSWTQTGYQIHAIGSLLDFLVELSFVGVQFLLLVTTLLFYTQQGAITAWQPVFESKVQALQAFIMVWMGGLMWCFAFRYPSTGVQSLFLRRCELRASTHVAVVAPIKTIAAGGGSGSTAKPTYLGQAATMFWTPVDCVLRTLFSYPYDQPGLETVFCLVETDLHTQTRSILHRMRRYVYDDETKCFIPCAMNVGTTFGDLSQQVGGLTNEEAHRRLGRQGPNVIPLSKPSILRSLYKEFRKSFYLYQNFCIWAFANFWFFFMSFVYTFYRFVGALVVVYFQHRSDSLLYNLSHVEGTVQYVAACTRVSRQLPYLDNDSPESVVQTSIGCFEMENML